MSPQAMTIQASRYDRFGRARREAYPLLAALIVGSAGLYIAETVAVPAGLVRPGYAFGLTVPPHPIRAAGPALQPAVPPLVTIRSAPLRVAVPPVAPVERAPARRQGPPALSPRAGPAHMPAHMPAPPIAFAPAIGLSDGSQGGAGSPSGLPAIVSVASPAPNVPIATLVERGPASPPAVLAPGSDPITVLPVTIDDRTMAAPAMTVADRDIAPSDDATLPIAADAMPSPVGAARFGSAPDVPIVVRGASSPAQTIARPRQVRDGVAFEVSTKINGAEAGRLSLLIAGADMRHPEYACDEISVRLADLIDILTPRMDPAHVDRLMSSQSAQQYVTLNDLRAHGISVSFDRHDRLLLKAV